MAHPCRRQSRVGPSCGAGDDAGPRQPGRAGPTRLDARQHLAVDQAPHARRARARLWNMPVLVAEVDDSRSEPQVGLGRAILVVEGSSPRAPRFARLSPTSRRGPGSTVDATIGDIGVVQPVDSKHRRLRSRPMTIKRIKDFSIHFFGKSTKDSTTTAPDHAVQPDARTLGKPAPRASAERPNNLRTLFPLGQAERHPQ